MPLMLEELEATRGHMLREYEAELGGANPYKPARLSAAGIDAWPRLMKNAIERGNDESLRAAISARPDYFKHEESTVKGSRKINIGQASEQLATNEYNTFYVRGLSAKLLEEGVKEAEVYRAATPRWEPGGCATHEGTRVEVQAVYDGHRAAYWPVHTASVLSVPSQPGCHHSIRRLLN